MYFEQTGSSCAVSDTKRDQKVLNTEVNVVSHGKIYKALCGRVREQYIERAIFW